MYVYVKMDNGSKLTIDISVDDRNVVPVMLLNIAEPSHLFLQKCSI